MVPHLVNGSSAVVCKKHLFAESPKNLAHAVNSCSIIELAQFKKLRQKVCSTLYGAGNQLREEAYESEECHHIVGRLNLALVNINGVTERLKGVKRDANGQYQMERNEAYMPAKGCTSFLKALGKEVVILVDTQDSKVKDNIGSGNPLG
jgi:hypothetical protein